MISLIFEGPRLFADGKCSGIKITKHLKRSRCPTKSEIFNFTFLQSFLSAAKKYGVPDEEVFQTPDLFEARNIPQVSLCIFSLGKVA